MKKILKKRRRAEGKTDYKARVAMLKSGKARVVFRRTNRYIIGQYVKSKEAADYVLAGANSKELLDYGWLKTSSGSLKSLPASYLTGFLLGKKISDKEGEEGIFDLGLLRNVKKSRAYAFLKGVADAGIKVKANEEIFPDEKRIKGMHMKSRISEVFEKIKENINKKFA